MTRQRLLSDAHWAGAFVLPSDEREVVRHCTLKRLNKEVKRRADVVGIFPEASIVCLIGAVLLEANDEWQLQHPYMGVEALAELLNPNPTNGTLQLPPRAA